MGGEGGWWVQGASAGLPPPQGTVLLPAPCSAAPLLPQVRSKLLPALMEWDLCQAAAALRIRSSSSGGGGLGALGIHSPPQLPSSSTRSIPQVELRPVEVQKVHGQRGVKAAEVGEDGEERHWRYVLRWERSQVDLEGLGRLQVRVWWAGLGGGGAAWLALLPVVSERGLPGGGAASLHCLQAAVVGSTPCVMLC